MPTPFKVWRYFGKLLFSTRRPVRQCSGLAFARWLAQMRRMIRAELVTELAREIGFDHCSVVPALPPPTADILTKWVAAGYAAEMRWLVRNLERRTDPRRLLPNARSVISVALSYFCQEPAPTLWNDPARGRLARYAWGPDYHELLRSKLKTLATSLEAAIGRHFDWRACVDSSPILERGIAATRAGFIGRNAVYIHPTYGLYVVLGELVISEDAEETPINRSAGTECPPCAACMKACPTQALTAPYTLDARRCIAYHTVENRGIIPTEFRERIERWLFGCDECIQVCPFAKTLSCPGSARLWSFDPERCCPRLDDVLRWTEQDFLDRYRGSVVERLGWRLFLRNAIVASGHSTVEDLIPLVQAFATHQDDLLKTHAEWALARLRAAHRSRANPE